MHMTRSIACVALVAAIGSGCGAATTTSEPTTLSTQMPSPAAATTAPAASSAAVPTPAPTEAPPPTPVASIDPKAPATVSGTQAPGSKTKEATWSKVNGVRQGRGHEEEVVLSLSDPRVNGMALVRTDYDFYETEPGKEVATMTGTMRIDAPGGGTWEGPCTGGIWEYSHFSDTCWLAGSGPYEGMTFFYQLLHGAAEGELVVNGLIYPGAPLER